ncbi:MAG: hypothetical protein ACRDD8_11045 [Bacteroidales bacterium]
MNKSLKYSDVFNNPDNNYACPSFPTCSNSNYDDYYFEFIDAQSAGIINNHQTLQKMDLSDISAYVESWSQDTKTIKPKSAIFISGEEYGPQKKRVVYKETSYHPHKDPNKSYFLKLLMNCYVDAIYNSYELLVPLLGDVFDIGAAIAFLQTVFDKERIDCNVTYVPTTDGYNVLVFEAKDDSVIYDIIKDPYVIVRDEPQTSTRQYVLINDKLLHDMSEIKNSMDKDRDNQADVWWTDESAPNKLIPEIFDTDSDGFVDVWWDGEADNPSGEVIPDEDKEPDKVLTSIKFDLDSIREYNKYMNGAFKGICAKFVYPRIKDGMNNYVNMPENVKTIKYINTQETFRDSDGKTYTLHMSGPMYNGNRYMKIIGENNYWQNTSLMYLNIANCDNLIRGMIFYNPNDFPVAITYIKFN